MFAQGGSLCERVKSRLEEWNCFKLRELAARENAI